MSLLLYTKVSFLNQKTPEMKRTLINALALLFTFYQPIKDVIQNSEPEPRLLFLDFYSLEK